MARPLHFALRQLGDLALGASLTVAIFLIAEACLLLAGGGDDSGAVAAPRHLAAGFDEKVEVFIPDPEQPGGWRGNYSHNQSKELVIPPKGEARRVLIFGGSNAAGFPRRDLKDALNALGEQEYEVINLGRAGYGSTRVAILFREALSSLEPDVVVLYSGHNEFVEKSFAMDLEEAWNNPIVAGVAGLVEQTLTGRWLTRLVQAKRAAGHYTRLRDWEAEYKKFSDLPWSSTLKVWSAYEENLRYMGNLAATQGVPMLLCTPVWNRLSSPRVDTPSPGSPDGMTVERGDRVSEGRHLHEQAMKLYPKQMAHLLPRQDKQRLHLFDWGNFRDTFGDGRVQDPLPGIRPSTGWLAEEDPRFYMDREWGPRIRPWYEALEWLHGPRSPEDLEALAQSEELLSQALGHLPESAIIAYEHALARYASGARGAEIMLALEEAARLDRAPRKANPHSNDCVRRVAADIDGVSLFDADQRFASGCPDGLIAWEWMTDHCHLSPGAGSAFMRDIADEVAGLLAEGPR